MIANTILQQLGGHGFTVMTGSRNYNVNSTKSCRDAFLRLSKPLGLRKRQFYSAILLAETQECVSTR